MKQDWQTEMNQTVRRVAPKVSDPVWLAERNRSRARRREIELLIMRIENCIEFGTPLPEKSQLWGDATQRVFASSDALILTNLDGRWMLKNSELLSEAKGLAI